MDKQNEKHTPGPWIARWTERRYAGQREAVKVCHIGKKGDKSPSSMFIAAQMEGPFGDLEQAQANANLIAASPDLLETAEAIEYWLEAITPYGKGAQENGKPKMLKMLRTVIAKAKNLS